MKHSPPHSRARALPPPLRQPRPSKRRALHNCDFHGASSASFLQSIAPCNLDTASPIPRAQLQGRPIDGRLSLYGLTTDSDICLRSCPCSSPEMSDERSGCPLVDSGAVDSLAP